MIKYFFCVAAFLSTTVTGVCQQADETEKHASQFNYIYNLKNDTFDIFTKEPNAFLVKTILDMKPGTALDVAMGEGRNSIYLAQKRWEVTGFDVAEEGLKIANQKAIQAGVKINAIKDSWQNFDFGNEKWDLVILSYAWVPLTDSTFIKRIYNSLKKDGIVILEHPLDSPSDVPGPESVINAVLKTFLNFHIIFYEDTFDISDWRRSRDERKTNKFRTLRLIGKKI